MSTQNKEINHDFKIGDIVYILKDYSIRKGIVTAIECSPNVGTYVSNMQELLDYSTKIYTICIISNQDQINVKDYKQLYVIKPNTYYKDSYSYDKVYSNVDDLLSDLRNSVEKSS